VAAEDEQRPPTSPTRKTSRATTAKSRGRKSAAGGTASTGSDEARATGAGDPLELEGAGGFTPPDEPTIDPGAVDDDYEPLPQEPLEWTPERAAAVVKASGYVLHAADPLSAEPGGEELWRATEQDAADIGSPLSRILNRYAPARRLAGVADEGELAFAMLAYGKRNLVQRGRLVAARREREAAAPGYGEGFHDEDEPGGSFG
jgi:hypothetical protein